MTKNNRITRYDSYPGSGWVSIGRLVVNYHHNRVTSVFFDGAMLFERREA